MAVGAPARQQGRAPLVLVGAVLGFVASGLLHVLLGWVTLQVAYDLPGGDQPADERGALRVLAGTEHGAVLLWLLVAGFAAITLWQADVARAGACGIAERVKAAGRAAVYAALAASALAVVRHPLGGELGPTKAPAESFTGWLLAQPWGRASVGALGGVVVGVALYHVAKGASSRFLRDLREHPGRWIVAAGRFGYAAKGVALLLVGGFFVAAAVGTEDEPLGLDGALRAVADMPLGTVLLTAAAVGFVAFGAYTFGRAVYFRP